MSERQNWELSDDFKSYMVGWIDGASGKKEIASVYFQNHKYGSGWYAGRQSRLEAMEKSARMFNVTVPGSQKSFNFVDNSSGNYLEQKLSEAHNSEE
jgi:hypothetical protein